MADNYRNIQHVAKIRSILGQGLATTAPHLVASERRVHHSNAMDAPTPDAGHATRRRKRGFAVAGQQPESPPPGIAPNSEAPGTILSIQVLRFVAALSVVVFHAHNALLDRLPEHRPDSVDHAFQVGASGVHIFFVISGFVMAYTTWRSQLTPGAFLSRRLIRIYPIYWLVAAAYLLAHILLGTAYDLSPGQIAGAILLLPHDSSLIIGPGWTLSFEMYFYLCFALVLFAGLRRGLVILSVLYAASVVAGFMLAPQSPFGHLVTDSLLLEFMTGAWLGYAFAHGLKIGPRVGIVLTVTSLALFASGFWLDYERLPSVASWGVPSLFLVAGALAFEPRLRSLLGRRLAKLGDSSYLLYLSHILTLDLLIATPVAVLNGNERTAMLLSIPLAASCVVVAALGYEVVELPLLKVTRRLFIRRPKAVLKPSTAAQ